MNQRHHRAIHAENACLGSSWGRRILSQQQVDLSLVHGEGGSTSSLSSAYGSALADGGTGEVGKFTSSVVKGGDPGAEANESLGEARRERAGE